MTTEQITPLRWGILGTGRVLAKLVPAFGLARAAELVAIASRDSGRARSAAAQWNIARTHTSYEALIADSEVDVVLNALHNGLHCEWSIRALEAGKHVLCEKPLACSADEVERMFAAAHANKRRLMEGLMYRFHPQIAAVKRRIAAGEIAKVQQIRSSYTGLGRERTNPRYRRDAGGGALMDIGCYCVNFSRLIADAEPKRVTAEARFDEETGVDLTLSGTMEFPNAVGAQFICSFEAEGGYQAEIIGTEGKVVIPHPWLPPTWPSEFFLTRGGVTETVRVEDLHAPPHFLAPFALEIEHLSACVRNGRAPTFPPGIDAERDSRGNMRVIEALLSSARSGAPVEWAEC